MEYDGIFNQFQNTASGSISELVCESLRVAIINHQLHPGERLVEAKLAKAMKVSITPVRYAFTQLSKEGLIDIQPYCGTYVKILTKKYIREVCQVRALMEVEAAKVAFYTITTSDIDFLSKQIELLSCPIDSFKSLYDACRADTKFHDLIFQRSDNETLIQFWNILRVRMEFITSFTKTRTDSSLQKKRHVILVNDLTEHNLERFLSDIHDHCINANFESFVD